MKGNKSFVQILEFSISELEILNLGLSPATLTLILNQFIVNYLMLIGNSNCVSTSYPNKLLEVLFSV